MSDSLAPTLLRPFAVFMGFAALGCVTAGVFILRLELSRGRVPLGGAAAIIGGAFILHTAVRIYRKVRGTS